jgi:integrase/recombinase XerD
VTRPPASAEPPAGDGGAGDGPLVTRDGREASDAHVIRLWCQGKAPGTVDTYTRTAARFLDLCREGRPQADDTPGAPAVPGLAFANLLHLHAFRAELERRGLATSTVAQRLACLKSLFTFASRIGYVPRNWGAMLDLPSAPDRLSERIMPRADVRALIQGETDATRRLCLRVLYFAGLRVSEAAGLTWRDVQPVTVQGVERVQLSVFGKGSKTRRVLLPSHVGTAVLTYRREHARPAGVAGKGHAVFTPLNQAGDGPHHRTDARKGASRSTVWRWVKGAAARAGVDPAASTHWLRHAHASHALDAGAPVHLVRQGLGHASLATTTKYAHARPDASAGDYLDAGAAGDVSSPRDASEAEAGGETADV